MGFSQTLSFSPFPLLLSNVMLSLFLAWILAIFSTMALSASSFFLFFIHTWHYCSITYSPSVVAKHLSIEERVIKPHFPHPGLHLYPGLFLLSEPHAFQSRKVTVGPIWPWPSRQQGLKCPCFLSASRIPSGCFPSELSPFPTSLFMSFSYNNFVYICALSHQIGSSSKTEYMCCSYFFLQQLPHAWCLGGNLIMLKDK